MLTITKGVSNMTYKHLEDLHMVFHFAQIVLVWTLLHKSVLWVFRNDIRSFNILFGAMYIAFYYFEMKSLRIIIVVILSVINSLQLLSK